MKPFHACNRRQFLLSSVAATVGMFSVSPAFGRSHAPANDALANGFHRPPHAAKPQTWWHWMDGNVTREGITADLEAIHEIGLGGVQVFNVSYQIPFGNVHYMSAEWLELMRHAATECDRLGLEMGMHNCSGWSSSGGPWVTPDYGMKKVVWSETPATAGHFIGTLVRPACGKYDAYYHDIAVLACRCPAQEGISLDLVDAKISTGNSVWPATPSPVYPGAELPLPTSSSPVQAYGAVAANLDITLPGPSNVTPQYIQIETPNPFHARSLFLDYRIGSDSVTCEVQTSDNGQAWQTLVTTHLKSQGQPTINFPQVTSRYFRVLFTTSASGPISIRVRMISLVSGYRLPEWSAKAGFAPLENWTPAWDETPPEDTVFKSSDILDVSKFMTPEGVLDWMVPEGDWTILRFGYAPNGRPNTHPEEPAGVGLEVDKLDKKALEFHFKHMTKVMVDTMGPLNGKSFTNLLIDSYEVGPQNWTAAFSDLFRVRAGYDLIPFLPLFTGRVIDSTDTTERVLWDVRKLIADLFAENYYGHFGTLCHQYGLRSAIEPYGGPYSIMDCAKGADLPMTEFWTGGAYLKGNARSRMVVSAAHLNGQSVVGAEAFTSGFMADRYTLAPCDLKALGDFQFCEGINRFIFHRFALQPWLDKKPGMTMGPWGLHFDRTQTWWKEGFGYIDYVTRCQFLLQAGQPVADILAYTGEDGQSWARWRNSNLPPVPYGYDYDFINLKALSTARVVNGLIILGNGMSYRLLLLPDNAHMTLTSLEVIASLVRAGAIVSGPRPMRDPHYSSTRSQAFDLIITELWGDDASGCKTSGRGKLYWGTATDTVLANLGARPDFHMGEVGMSDHISYKHRALEAGDIYFISSQNNTSSPITATFRVTGKIPELWHATTGLIEVAPVYWEKEGMTTVPIILDPAGSVFVVFRQSSHEEHPTAISTPPQANYYLTRSHNSLQLIASTPGDYDVVTSAGRHLSSTLGQLNTSISLDDNWTVTFPPGLGAPESIHLAKLQSLSENTEPGVRYFSGTCTYARNLQVAANMLTKGDVVMLDLGNVQKLAHVRVNGIDFGVQWTLPYRVDIAKALKVGDNHVQIEVTNVWANRLIGDEQFPDECEWIFIPGRGWRLKEWPKWFINKTTHSSERVTFSTWRFYNKNDSLPSSGIIGPIIITVMKAVTLY